VVCKQLGYTGALNATVGSHFGAVSTDFSYDDVICSTDDGSLDECKHEDIGITNLD